MEVRGLEGETGGEPHDCPEEWWEVQVQPRVGNRGLGSQRGEGRDTLAVYHRAREDRTTRSEASRGSAWLSSWG